MAGNCDRYGVGCASSGDGARRRRHADFLGHGAVGARFSAGNSLQTFPDSPLKSGGPDVERKRGIGLLALNEARQVLSPLGHRDIVTAANRERELADQALLELLIGVGELDGADALVGGGDQHASERRTGDGVADDSGYSSAAVLLRGHAELRGRALVETTAGAVSGGIERGGHGVAGLQILFYLAQAAGVDVGLRRHAEHRFEGPLQVKRAAPKFFGQKAKRQAVFDMLFDVAAHGADQRGLGVSVHRLGTAAQAGAIAGLLGLERVIVKTYVLVARAFGGARGAAEDPSAGHAEDERAVQGGVTVDDGLPAALFDFVFGRFWSSLRHWFF